MHLDATRLALCSVLTVSLAACAAEPDAGDTGGSESGSSSAGDSGSADTGPGDPEVLVGSFQLQLAEPDDDGGTTTMIGKVYDGPTPATLVWEVASETGDCRLSKPRVPFCSTPCGGSAACVEDEVCQPYPTARSAGTVTVTGVATGEGDTQFTMMPIAENYQPTVALAYPAFAEGDAIGLSAEGDETAPFEIAGVGIAQLQLDGDAFPLDAASDLVLTWTAAQAGAASSVHVKLDISHHGGTKGMIECDVDDVGTVTIPAALVSELLDLGVAGFPTVIVTRSTVGSTTIPAGRIDLVVSSSIERTVTVAGVTSCTEDAECPDGQTCQSDLTCK
ncbi:MAG: hypothetical protein U0168_01790 [Nannocystaceae bacterium]